MSKRLIILMIFVAVSLAIIAGERNCSYLADPEFRDISNNGIEVYKNSGVFELKFTSCDSISYYVMWPQGADTLPVRSDSLGIFRIQVNPSVLNYGEYWVEVLNASKEKEINFSFRVNQDINFYLTILNVLLGLVFFMMGLRFSSKGLSHISGYRLKEILWNLSDSPLKGSLAGIILTVMLQSSTVFSVMITSFVSDKLIGIVGAIAMLAGSAIGTSIVVQIIAFDISFFSLIMIIGGFFLYDRIKRAKNIGSIMMGFGLIFLAIKLMAGAILPIQDTAVFQNIIIFLQNNPILLFIITSLFTFSVHSSAVTIALVMGLSITGQIPYQGAIIMIAAANLGTTFTATMASVKGNRQSKYVAIVNAAMKLIVSILFLIVFFNIEGQFPFMGTDARGIANMHLAFNVFFAAMIIILIPLIRYFGEKIKKRETPILNRHMIDESMNKTPTLALGHIYNEIIRTAGTAYDMYDKSFEVFKTNNVQMLKQLVERDNEIDRSEKEITLFLVNLSEEELPSKVSSRIKSMLFIIDEIEHIGDIVSKNLMVSARKKIENNYYFSDEGFDDIKMMYSEVRETLSKAIGLMTMYDANETEIVLARRKGVLDILNKLHIKHLKRMEKAIKESIETSTLHLDILNDYERINFHSYKMCTYIKEMQK